VVTSRFAEREVFDCRCFLVFYNRAYEPCLLPLNLGSWIRIDRLTHVGLRLAL